VFAAERDENDHRLVVSTRPTLSRSCGPGLTLSAVSWSSAMISKEGRRECHRHRARHHRRAALVPLSTGHAGRNDVAPDRDAVIGMAAISNWFMMAVDQAGEGPMDARRERELIKG
jgi:hypothetical protein